MEQNIDKIKENKYWRENLQKEIEEITQAKDPTSTYIPHPKEMAVVLTKMYILFVNEIADIMSDLTNIHDSILEINKELGITYNPKNL